MSAGGLYTCALDDTGVVCWGDDAYGESTLPELTNPTQVSAGEFQTCALDDTGVVCTSDGTLGQIILPELINPTLVRAYMQTCALDDTGVVCWNQTCALAWPGEECPGLEFVQAWDGQTTVPELLNPTQVVRGIGHSCVLDNTGVVCWGSNPFGGTTFPELTKPTQVSAGEFHSCALDDTGVVCWDRDSYGQSAVPNLYIDPDGDGYTNQNRSDAFTLDSSEWFDTDLDGIGDNADRDDDSVLDHDDVFPSDASESADTDGVGNNADTDDDDSFALMLGTFLLLRTRKKLIGKRPLAID